MGILYKAKQEARKSVFGITIQEQFSLFLEGHSKPFYGCWLTFGAVFCHDELTLLQKCLGPSSRKANP